MTSAPSRRCSGCCVLIIIFTIAAPSTFLTTFNLANLLTQAGAICILAMGIGFVLLLGHIDLSAGVIGGVGAAVMAMLMLKQGLPWYLAVLVALLVGVAMGIFTGVLVSAVGIPSFVVTLATFLAYQGVLLWIIGTGGTVPINDPVIFGMSNGNMPVLFGWVVVIVSMAALRGVEPAGLPTSTQCESGDRSAGDHRAADRGDRGRAARRDVPAEPEPRPRASSCWRASRGSPRWSVCCW